MRCCIPTTGPACSALASLVLGHANSAVDNITANHLHDITATLPGEEQQGKRQALACTKWPATLELSDFCVRPGVVSTEPISLQTGKWIVGAHSGRNGVIH